MYVDRLVEAPKWIRFPTYTSPAGGNAETRAVEDYLSGDIASVAAQGSFNTDVFSIAGTNEDIVITGTPRATVSDLTRDTITLRAVGESPGRGLTPTADNSWTVVSIPEGQNTLFWTGPPGITINESTTPVIALSQYLHGMPDGSFDKIEIVSTTPNSDWIVLENPTNTMARLAITAPEISSVRTVSVVLRATRSTASPKTADTTFTITVLPIIDVQEQGISIVRYDVPQGRITSGTFNVDVYLDAPLETGDTLVAADFRFDGLDGVAVTAVTKHDTNEQRYILTCTAENNIEGIVNLQYVGS